MTRHLPEMMDAESVGKFDGVRSEMLLPFPESCGLRVDVLSPFTVGVIKSCQSHGNGHVSHSNGHVSHSNAYMIDRDVTMQLLRNVADIHQMEIIAQR